MDEEIEYGKWVEVYPCKEGCGFVLPPAAYWDGRVYKPCQNCGAKIGDSVARRKYKVVVEEVTRSSWFGLVKKKTMERVRKFIEWEMRNKK